MSKNQIFKSPRVAHIIDSNTSKEEKIIALYYESPLFTVTELSRYFLLDETTIRVYLDRAKYKRYANK